MSYSGYGPKNARHWRGLSSVLAGLVCLIVALNPLAIYRTPVGGVNLSLDRGSLVVTILFSMVFVFVKPKLVINKNFYLVVLLTVASVAITSIPIFVPFRYIAAKLPILIMNLFLMVAIFEICRDDESRLRLVLHALVVVGVFYILFAVFTMYSFLVLGTPPLDVPFHEYIPFPMPNTKEGHLFAEGGFALGDLTRLTLPFATPPHLGLASILVAILLLGLLPFVNKWRRFLLACLIGGLIVVCLFSGSRSGIFPMFVGLSLYSVLYSRHYFHLTVKKLISLFVLLSVITAGIFFLWDALSVLANVTQRLTDSSGYSAHLAVRSLTVDRLFNASPWELIFGHGLGSFPDVTGISSGHMSYGTLLIERGLVGFAGFVLLLLFLAVSLKRIPLAKLPWPYGVWKITAVCCLTVIIVANFLYEFYYITPMWAAMGWIAAFGNSRRLFAGTDQALRVDRSTTKVRASPSEP